MYNKLLHRRIEFLLQVTVKELRDDWILKLKTYCDPFEILFAGLFELILKVDEPVYKLFLFSTDRLNAVLRSNGDDTGTTATGNRESIAFR